MGSLPDSTPWRKMMLPPPAVSCLLTLGRASWDPFPSMLTYWPAWSYEDLVWVTIVTVEFMSSAAMSCPEGSISQHPSSSYGLLYSSPPLSSMMFLSIRWLIWMPRTGPSTQVPALWPVTSLLLTAAHCKKELHWPKAAAALTWAQT